MHYDPNLFDKSVNIDSFSMVAFGRVDTVFSIPELGYVSNGISNGSIVFYTQLLKSID